MIILGIVSQLVPVSNDELFLLKFETCFIRAVNKFSFFIIIFSYGGSAQNFILLDTYMPFLELMIN